VTGSDGNPAQHGSDDCPLLVEAEAWPGAP